MAKTSLGAESAHVITPNQFPPAAAALLAQRLLNRHSAHEIAEAVEVLIDVLDLLGGDPDLEDSGDLEPDDDAKGDPAWLEWNTRGRHKTGRYGGEKLARDRYGNAVHEDAEEDDDPGQCTEDEISTLTALAHGSAAGCKISDPAEPGDTFEHPEYGADQSLPIGYTEAEQLARWNSLPTGAA